MRTQEGDACPTPATAALTQSGQGTPACELGHRIFAGRPAESEKNRATEAVARGQATMTNSDHWLMTTKGCTLGVWQCSAQLFDRKFNNEANQATLWISCCDVTLTSPHVHKACGPEQATTDRDDRRLTVAPLSASCESDHLARAGRQRYHKRYSRPCSFRYEYTQDLTKLFLNVACHVGTT